jgi:hypothetical protein
LLKKHYQEKITMSGVKKLGATALIVLFALNSCTDFVTTSWGEMFRRDPKNVRVTASTVDDLLDAATGDRELSRAILDKINANSDDTLKRAAIKAANQAAGISTVALENVKDLMDASKNKDGDALTNLIESILDDVRDNDVKGIGEKVTGILQDKVESSARPKNSKEALILAENVTLSATTRDNKEAEISIDVGSEGMGTVTITVGDNSKSYPCVITDDKTITLTGAGENGENVVLEYAINDANRALTLKGLEEIPNVNLKDSASSDPYAMPAGKPEFQAGFIDDSIPESDLTLLLMTLILAKSEKETGKYGSLDNYMETWADKDVETGKGLDPEELLIASIINFMMKRGDDMSELSEMITDLLRMGEK